ncbi:MAG: hypothetical protein CBE23_002055 [Candidatus Pelagibacter sp. TMED263]|nr:MAG: hypothetical protein CBE23_002055 [Candidatus Pelagibacter sp. TMED263]
MKFLSNNFDNIFKTENILNLSAFILIIFVFINFIHNSSDRYQLVENNTYVKMSNNEFKKNINNLLIADSTYAYKLDKKCEITGNMHDRHKVRWVKALFLKHIFKISHSTNPSLPYYVNILLHSFLIFLTLIFLNKAFKLEKIFIVFFLLYITFVFQQHLGEYSYSIFEMFFVSIALYASKNKNILLLSLVSILAVLNRESGFLIPLIWLIFNSDYKKLIICFGVVFTTFFALNFNLIECLFNPKFFIPLERQEGQVNISDLKYSNFFSVGKLLIINFIFPFGIIILNYIKSNIKNNFFVIIVSLYFLMFLFATPIHHVAVRMIILPLIFTSFYLAKQK